MDTHSMEEELTLEQSIELLLADVPLAVRNFVLHDLQPATQRLMERYNLHADHAGVLERELLLMLLGQSKPEEFMAALREAGVAEETVKELTADVNREVFMPLREEERQPAQPAVPPPSPAPTTPTTPPAPPSIALPEHDHNPLELPVVQETPMPVPQTPEQPAPPRDVERPAPMPPPSLAPKEPPAIPAPKPEPMQIFAERKKAMPSPPSNLPGQEPINRMERLETVPPETKEPAGYITHTMSGDMTALKEGKSAFEIAHPTRQPEPSPPPIPAEPQKPEPLTTPPITPSQQTPPPQTPAPSMSASKQEGPRPPAPKSYGADPYREPIE